MLKGFKQLDTRTQTVTKPSANRKIEITKGEQVRAVIGKNRSTEGQYKIDVFDVSDQELASLEAAIKRVLAE